MTESKRIGMSFVVGPKGRKPTREEAEKMAAALFDSITPTVADNARRQDR